MRRSSKALWFIVAPGLLAAAAWLVAGTKRPANVEAPALASASGEPTAPMVLRAPPVPRPTVGRTTAPPPWQLVAPAPLRYPPGSYVPRGFDADFRQRIVAEFQTDLDRKLGPEFPPERRAQIAKVQNEFWDENGPNVDLFQDGKISQPEFAERTHLALIKESESFARVLSDDEFEKLFDFPKGVDFYTIMAHSGREQAGLAFQAEKTNAPLASNMAPPGAPPRAPPAPPEGLAPAAPRHTR